LDKDKWDSPWNLVKEIEAKKEITPILSGIWAEFKPKVVLVNSSRTLF